MQPFGVLQCPDRACQIWGAVEKPVELCESVLCKYHLILMYLTGGHYLILSLSLDLQTFSAAKQV